MDLALAAILLILVLQLIDRAKADIRTGQVICLSCLTKPPSYSNINESELHVRLKRSGLNLPVEVKSCKDTPSTGRPDWTGVDTIVCPHSKDRPSTCVKLKGEFMGEPYVYRECWDRMWYVYRNFDGSKQGKCFYDDVQFVTTENNLLCFCEEDLCNATSVPPRSTTYIILFLISLIFMPTML